MNDQKRAVIDTNLLVRYLTEDDPSKANDVRRLLLKAAQGEVRLLVPSVVIAELVWVLESFYRLERSRIVPLLNVVLSGINTYFLVENIKLNRETRDTLRNQ